MAKKEKTLSQSEIDALAARVGDEELQEEPEESGAPDADVTLAPRARSLRTLSQEEIDTILFADSEGETAPVEETTVAEETTPVEEPAPSRMTAVTEKAKPARKTKPVEEASEIEEPPAVEETPAEDELDKERVAITDSLAALAQRMDIVEASCERIDDATTWIERIGAITERLQTIETTLARIVQMERNEEDIDDILDRLRKIEETTDIDAIREHLRDIQASTDKPSLMHEDFHVVEAETAKLSARIEGIAATLKDSIGYGIHRDFTCRSCGSKGHVAITIRCTDCGKEGWMGWWPEKR